MSLLSLLVPLLRVYYSGLAVILHQLRRRLRSRCPSTPGEHRARRCRGRGAGRGQRRSPRGKLRRRFPPRGEGGCCPRTGRPRPWGRRSPAAAARPRAPPLRAGGLRAGGAAARCALPPPPPRPRRRPRPHRSVRSAGRGRPGRGAGRGGVPGPGRPLVCLAARRPECGLAGGVGSPRALRLFALLLPSSSCSCSLCLRPQVRRLTGRSAFRPR